MSEQSRELQILRELLGDTLGRMVFGLNVMAGSIGQLGEQLQQQAQQLEQLQAAASPASSQSATENHWTGVREVS